MHRTIEITVPHAATETLLQKLESMDQVVGLSVQPGASLKPPGDVVTVHVLNRGADDVLKHAGDARRHGPISVATAELSSIADPEHQATVEDDVDEGLWEEMETGLRHHGRVTSNFLILMALGGAIAAAGFVSDPVPQAIAFVAASVIAPGFEPLAKIPLGLVLRRWHVVRRGAVSALLGYGALILAAALLFLILRATGTVTVDEFVNNPEVDKIAHPTLVETLVSACAAVAGAIMIAAYRRTVIAGPLIALVLIPAAAMAGAALGAGRAGLFFEALQRLGLDIVLIVALGGLVFFAKQAITHRRPSLV